MGRKRVGVGSKGFSSGFLKVPRVSVPVRFRTNPGTPPVPVGEETTLRGEPHPPLPFPQTG